MSMKKVNSVARAKCIASAFHWRLLMILLEDYSDLPRSRFII